MSNNRRPSGVYVSYNSNVDNAIRRIENAGVGALVGIGKRLKRETRQEIKQNFKTGIKRKRKRGKGRLLSNVRFIVSKEKKTVWIGINKRAFHSLFLHEGTAMRRHRSGKEVGRIKKNEFMLRMIHRNRRRVERIAGAVYRRRLRS